MLTGFRSIYSPIIQTRTGFIDSLHRHIGFKKAFSNISKGRDDKYDPYPTFCDYPNLVKMLKITIF
jgi:hypothetical protein